MNLTINIFTLLSQKYLLKNFYSVKTISIFNVERTTLAANDGKLTTLKTTFLRLKNGYVTKEGPLGIISWTTVRCSNRTSVTNKKLPNYL